MNAEAILAAAVQAVGISPTTVIAVGAVVIGAIGALGGGVSAIMVQRSRSRTHDRDNRAAPYEDIAARLRAIENQADQVPLLRAHLWHFHLWSEQIIEWAEEVRKLVNGTLGRDLPPMPPSPPFDRRTVDGGPPFGWNRRLGDHAAQAAPPPPTSDRVAPDE